MCVRSSITFYGNFNLDMDRSPGFGSTNTNFSPFSDLVSLRLHTFSVFNLANISNSPDRSTKSTQSELSLLLLFVSTRFQVLFHSPPGVLFTFPSQYFSTIGHRLVFRLGGWSPRLPTGFLVSRGTLDPARCPSDFAYEAFTPSGLLSQNSSAIFLLRFPQSSTPTDFVCRFGLFPFRSPLLRKSIFLSLPPGT